MSGPAQGAWRDRLAVAVVAAALLVASWPRAVGFTTDSDAYLDVAGNLLGGHGLVQRVVDFWRPGVPDPLGMWPPLYPLAIAALARTGVALPLAARLVAALAFMAFALAIHALARRAGGRGFALTATLLALGIPGLAHAGVTAWSETLYLALLATALVGAWDVGERGAGVARAALAGVALGLAADTRYVGVALLPVVSVLLLTSGAGRRERLAWLMGVLAPIVPWLVRNFVVFGHALGPARAAATGSALAAVTGVARAARWDFLPGALSNAVWSAVPALAAVGLACVWAVRTRGVARWAAWTAVVQLAIVAVAVASFGINAPEGRLTLVAWPFLMLAVCGAARAALVRAPQAAAAVAGLAVVATAVGVLRGFAALPVPPPDAAVRGRELAGLRALMGTGAGPVLSDAGHLLRLATDRAAVQIPPRPYRVREFTAADESAWRGRGVEEAVFRAANRGALGDYMAARTAGGAGAWAGVDSAAGFVRFRLSP